MWLKFRGFRPKTVRAQEHKEGSTEGGAILISGWTSDIWVLSSMAFPCDVKKAKDQPNDFLKKFTTLNKWYENNKLDLISLLYKNKLSMPHESPKIPFFKVI